MKSSFITVQYDGFPVVFAKRLTDLAASFHSEDIRIIWESKNIISDAKSILGIMALEVAKGTVLKLTVEGPREEEAVRSLAALFII
ncbi:HPr family phosphocarrier protein [Paenibacillus sp. NPDC058910]|uniref:HPr family phosphocarrier protein n=1 Tax=unclassified Paenibacillus TaxID=185978 RepID=UPI00368F49AA